MMAASIGSRALSVRRALGLSNAVRPTGNGHSLHRMAHAFPCCHRRYSSNPGTAQTPYREAQASLEKTFKSNLDGRIRLLRCDESGFRAEIGDEPLFMSGSIAVLPHSVFQWKVDKLKEISVETLALFPIYQPPLEILVIGTGKRMQLLDPKIREYCRANGTMVEICDTRNAMAAYNFLAGEGRLVGAALLVPQD